MKVTHITSVYIPLARISSHLAVREAVWPRAWLKWRDSGTEKEIGGTGRQCVTATLLWPETSLSSQPHFPQPLCVRWNQSESNFTLKHSGLMIYPLFTFVVHPLLCPWDAFSPVHALWIWFFLQSSSHLPLLKTDSSSHDLPQHPLSFSSGIQSAVCLTFPQLPQLLCPGGKRQISCSHLSCAIGDACEQST